MILKGNDRYEALPTRQIPFKELADVAKQRWGHYCDMSSVTTPAQLHDALSKVRVSAEARLGEISRGMFRIIQKQPEQLSEVQSEDMELRQVICATYRFDRAVATCATYNEDKCPS